METKSSQWIAVFTAGLIWISIMIAHFIVELKSNVEQTEERKEPATSSASPFRGTGPTTMVEKLERTAQAAMNSFLLLLTMTIMSVLPILYNCSTGVSCEKCLDNSVMASTVTLTWIFLGFSLVWIALEFFGSEERHVTGSRLLLTFIGQPLVLANAILVYWNWTNILHRHC